MAIEIKVPSIGESITEVTLSKWIKKDGEWVDRDEVIAELESEKATFEINAEQAGILHTIAKEDDTLNIGDVACTIDTDAQKPAGEGKPEAGEKEIPKEEKKSDEPKSESKPEVTGKPDQSNTDTKKEVKATPVAAAMMADRKVDVSVNKISFA